MKGHCTCPNKGTHTCKVQPWRSCNVKRVSKKCAVSMFDGRPTKMCQYYSDGSNVIIKGIDAYDNE